jgi:TRAP-type C4-dicarboxylate transport system permease small subunit
VNPNKLVSWSVVALEFLAAVALLAMMSVVAIDVVLRNLGVGYIVGVLDLTSLTLIVATGFAIPVTFVRNRHLVVELGTSAMAPGNKARLEAVWLLLGGLLLFYVAYVVLQEGLHLAEAGRYKGVLRISPLVHHGLVSFAIFASAVSMLVMVVRKWTGSGEPDDEGSSAAL